MRTYLSDLASRFTPVTHELSSLEPMFLLALRERGQTDNTLREDTSWIFLGVESFCRKDARATFGDKLMKGSYFCCRSWNKCEKDSSLLQWLPGRMAQHKHLLGAFESFQPISRRCMPILLPGDLRETYRQLP